jgi:hypothetical protein
MARLSVSPDREWAAMKADVSDEVFTFHPGEWVQLPYPGEPLPQDEPGAAGYVYSVDRDARTVHVSSERVERAVADLDVPYWLYHFAVELGAQPPARDIWPVSPRALAAGRGSGKSLPMELLATHFYASKPPDP